MIKILIADDYPLFREGLKTLLSGCDDMIVAGEAGDCREMLSMVYKEDYDVLLLEISMAGKEMINIILKMKCERPELSILVLSTYPEEQYARHVIRAGASVYLSKESAPEKLIETIRNIAKGKDV